MKLNETVEMMNSEDYSERFKAEYKQLIIRIRGLGTMLDKYKTGSLDFKPKCSYEVLQEQLRAMNHYALILRERAIIEKIDLM